MGQLGTYGSINTSLFTSLRGSQSRGKGISGSPYRGAQQLPPGQYRLRGGAGGRANLTQRVTLATMSDHIGPTEPKGEPYPDSLD